MFGFIFALVVGGFAGVIASRVMNADFGMLINIVLGIAGAFIFNVVFWLVFGVSGGNLLWQLIAGFAGACALIWAYREYKRRA